jgi:hypothetical protein
MPNFQIEKLYFLAEIFFPESGFFSRAKNQNSVKIMLWRINLSLQKDTFCDNWTTIVGQS